jgi:hypothetical protein
MIDDGPVSPLTLQGYCDIDGDQCDTPSLILPYSVTFAGVGTTNQLLVVGDGHLEFIGDQLDFDPLHPTQQFTVLKDVDGRIDDSTVMDPTDGNDKFFQSATITSTKSSIDAIWSRCPDTKSCPFDEYGVLLTRIAGGFDITFPDDTTGRQSEFLAATFSDSSPTPEPAAWALLIAGFGLAGSALRSRARSRVAG